MPTTAALTGAEMLCIIPFLAMVFLLLLRDLHKWPAIIHSKVIVFAIAVSALLSFAIKRAGGVGGTSSTSSTLPSAERAWLYIQFISVAVAANTTFASTASDWQRNSVRPNASILGQILGFPLAYFAVSIVGMLVASSSQLVYGQVIWDPFVYIDRLLVDEYTSLNRFVVFLIGAGLAWSAMISTILENLIPAGNDFASMLPKFVTIRRGYALCIILSLAFQPWFFMGSSSSFLTVITAFNLFMLANCGILVADYFLVAKGRIDVDQLFDRRVDGMYYYTKGFNYRALCAYTLAIAINFPGLLQNIGVFAGNVKLARSFSFAPITSSVVAGALYFALARWMPQPSYTNMGFAEPKIYRGWKDAHDMPEVEHDIGGIELYDEHGDKDMPQNVVNVVPVV